MTKSRSSLNWRSRSPSNTPCPCLTHGIYPTVRGRARTLRGLGLGSRAPSLFLEGCRKFAAKTARRQSVYIARVTAGMAVDVELQPSNNL